jgi:hypothetical protein
LEFFLLPLSLRPSIKFTVNANLWKSINAKEMSRRHRGSDSDSDSEREHAGEEMSEGKKIERA